MESTLSIALVELKARVGSYMGWGRGAEYDDAAWDDQQEFDIDGIVASGLARVYWPHSADGSPSYEWSFLSPTTTLTLESAASTIDLPDDYGGIKGEVVIRQSPSGSMGVSLRPTHDGHVDRAYAQGPDVTGWPLLLSIRTRKELSRRQSNRSEVYIYPTADQDYTLTLAYSILPEMLTTANPYPYGGAMMREVFLESCLAVAEQRLDDSSTIHSMEFDRRLMAAISNDRARKPQLSGYNGDRSSDISGRLTRDNWSIIHPYGLDPS